MRRNLEKLRAMFLKDYASVPAKMREEIIAIIDQRTYSWDSAFLEINQKTELGNKILEKLDDIGLFQGDENEH